MLDELTVSESAVAGVKKKRRIRRIIMSLVSLMLLLAVGTGAAYVAFLNHVVTTNIKHAALLPTAGTNPDGTKAGTSTPLRQPAAKDAQNILVVGSDSRGSVANGRSDVIVLVHISSDRKKVYLVHFPRDMYVNVPGHGKDKINAAFAYGGAPLLVQTLQELVAVPIDHMAVIGFDGFQAMTDALGGLDVYAEEASTEPGSGTVHVGVNHLGGKAALAFVRERLQLSEGDISRGRRQQAFIKALLLQSLSRETLTNPIRFAQLVSAGTQNLTLDNAFSIGDMRSEALAMRNLRSKDVAFITAPFTGFGVTPTGASIDIVDDAQMAQLSFALENDDMRTYPIGQQTP
jgi:polyisoprenyl-teichoic acid--peptidoglycan teichoic acid transferase